MPITIRSSQLNVKNNGSYVNLDAVADATTEQRVQQINTAANTAESNIAAKQSAALASISDISELQAMIKDTFSTSNAYAIGDYVIQDVSGTNKLFKFIADHPAGAWNASHVTEVKVGSEITALKAELEALKTRLMSGNVADAELHLGFYLDEDGDLCQVDDDE